MKIEYRSGDDNEPLSNGSSIGYSQPMPSRWARWIALFFAVTGLGIFALSTYLYLKQVAFMKTALTVPAQITELIEDTGDIGKDDTVYRPVLRFTTSDGVAHIVRASVGFSRGIQNVGDQVEVIYAPGKPDEADLNSFFSNWISVILGAIGLVFLGLGGLGVYLTGRNNL